VLGEPLGIILYYTYQLVGSFGLAVVVFAVIVKIPLFPIMYITHKNSIRLLQLQPVLDLIRRRYAGDRDNLHEAQSALFTREKYNPMAGFLPLLVQLLLVVGILQVMYHPLQYILRLDATVIASLVKALQSVYGDAGGFAVQLSVLEAVQHAENLLIFQTTLAGFPDGEGIFGLLQDTDLRFLGFNLGITPSFRYASPELLIVLLSGLAALSFCLVQNRISPGALSQSVRTNGGLTLFNVGISVYFAFAFPAGVGLYWAVGNLTAIGVVLLLNTLRSPKVLAPEALAHLQKSRRTPEEIKTEKQKAQVLRNREREDAVRFANAKKQVVFYALSGGQYKFYKTIIDYLTTHSDVLIHYLTNDLDDGVFDIKHPQIIPYYTGQRKAISLMLKLDAYMLVTTVPGFQNYHIKRSVVRDDIEYIYTFHSATSTHLIYRENAFDHFDTIFCVGAHQVAEIRCREEMAGLPKKRLVKVGYGLYDQLAASHTVDAVRAGSHILIAPSWQADNILELCIDAMLDALLGKGYVITVRPHPQFIRLFADKIMALTQTYNYFVSCGELVFELDFSSNTSIFTSNLLITDWSAIAYEFAYCTSRPCIFINTPMKVMNPNYERLGLEVLDITLRDKIGVSVALEDIGTLNEVAARLLSERESHDEHITQTLMAHLYHPGRSGEAGGKYILNQLKMKEAG